MDYRQYINYPTMQNQQLQISLRLIRESVQGEKEDELFYNYLISVAPTQEEKEIIKDIREDERKHNVMFRKIYKDFTGQTIPIVQYVTFKKPESYLDGIKGAIMGEANVLKKYEKIRQGLFSIPYRDMLSEIIIDELEHGSKYNYLYALNKNNTTNNKKSYTPDDWVRYIDPLVKRALAEQKEGINMEHLFQEFILSGVLVGLGKTPQDAIEQVEQWEKTGESKLLAQSKMNRCMW